MLRDKDKADMPEEIRQTCNEHGVAVVWHRHLVGTLSCDATKFQWAAPELKAAFSSITPGDVPASFKNLQPEGWLDEVLDRSPAEYRAIGRHFLGNLSVATTPDPNAFIASIHDDVLLGRIDEFRDMDGVFTGEYRGPDGAGLVSRFEDQLRENAKKPGTPRMSGKEIKVPMSLDKDGRLELANGRPFTHILKPSGRIAEGMDFAGAVGWAGLEMLSATGLPTAKHAIIRMPNGLPPAHLIERFDIPTEEQDGKTMILSQDFCSAARKSPNDRENGTMKLCAEVVNKMCTDREQSAEYLFQRTFAAWVMHDGDMHLKNIALLKTMEAGHAETLTTSFAPAYDAMTTTVFFDGGRDHLLLPIGDKLKQQNITEKDFLQFSRLMGIPDERARDIMLVTATQMARRIVDIATCPPAPISEHARSAEILKEVARQVVQRAKEFGAEVPEFFAQKRKLAPWERHAKKRASSFEPDYILP